MAIPLTKKWREEREDRWFEKEFKRLNALSKTDAGWKSVPLEELESYAGKPQQNIQAILGKLPTEWEDAARAYLNHDGIAGPLDALAMSAASIPIKYYNANTAERGPGSWKESKSPIAQALQRINPLSTNSPFTHYAETYYHLMLAGDAYWYFDDAGYVFRLRPDRTEIETSGGLPTWFNYTVDQKTYRYPADKVCHFRRFHPLNDHYGASPTLSLALTIESDFFMLGYQRDFFRNSAVPRILIMAKYHMSESARNRFIEHWKAKYKGVGKMFGLSLLEGGDFQVTDLAKNMRDSEFIDGRKENRKAIQTRFAVPGGILGEPGANYANLRKHNEAFWLNIVWVTVQHVLSQFNAWDRAERENVVAQPYVWGHLQMQQVILERMKDITPVSKDGIMTINEIRAAYGLPPVGWGDEWVQPGNIYGGGGTAENNTEEEPAIQPESESPSGGPGDKSSQPGLVKTKKNTPIKNSDATPALSKKDERFESRRTKWKAFDKQAEKHAEKWVRKFQPEFERQREAALKALESADIPKGKTLHDSAMAKPKGGHFEKLFALISRKAKDDDYDEWLDDLLDEMLDEEEEAAILAEIAHDEYMDMMNEYGQQAFDEVDSRGGTFDVSDENALEYVKEKEIKFATEVNHTTREQLRGLLIEKIDEGASIQKISEGVKEVFSRVDNLDPARARRARTIARTEVQSAANKGQLEGYYQGGAEKKEWVTSADELVREEHSAIDGEVVSIRSPFSNGLMYPGDVNGPAEEVINCRCTVAPVV